MTWLYVLLGILAYLLIGCLTLYLKIKCMDRELKDNKLAPDDPMVISLWPIFVVTILVLFIPTALAAMIRDFCVEQITRRKKEDSDEDSTGGS